MNPYIVTPQSFLSNSFERFIEIIPYLNRGPIKFKVFFFYNVAAFAKLIGAEENYNKIVRALKENNIEYSELPVYGFDELFFLLSRSEMFKKEIGYDGIIYCSPTNASYYISVSAGTVGFDGVLKFFLNFNNYTGRIFFKESDYKKLAYNPRWSLAGIDKTQVEYITTADYSECHYTLDDKTYVEVPLSRDDKGIDKGSQGYSYVSRKSGYRLKFWDYPKTYYTFEIDKIKRMLSGPSPKNLAVPKAIIYSKNEIAIGVVMENYSGVSIPFEKFSQLLKSPLRFMSSLMTGLINAEAFSYIHRDFHHNIIFDDDGYQAYIIDLDSVQYANFPPTAQSAENRSCLPAKYTIRGRYYSTVELSYWAAIMAISSVIVPNPRRGTCIIDASTEKGNYKINKDRYTELHKKAPHIADMALWQYNDCFPCHPMRILEAIKRDENGDEFESVLSNIYVYFDKEVHNQTHSTSYEKPDSLRGDYVHITQEKKNNSEAGRKEYIRSNENTANEHSGGTKVYQNVNENEKDTVKYSFPKKSGKKSENDNAVPIVNSEEDKKPKKSLLDNRFIAFLNKLFKIIVVTIFKKDIGTISISVDTDLPQEELYEEQYKILINNKLWKKPLIASIVIIVITIGLLIVSSLL
ncbi:hypothetical protein [Eubacterium sp.]|uniref:hypothetical protein n=1 Tax=uncultured Eubacterium sp. TaxID=165185 RepID=UPI0025DEAD33|nr:hypothetical protein [uncultured Eubacterium sp.]